MVGITLTRGQVEAWLRVAAGVGRCVDQLIGFLRVLTPEDPVGVGLPWMAKVVMASPDHVSATCAPYSYRATQLHRLPRPVKLGCQELLVGQVDAVLRSHHGI